MSQQITSTVHLERDDSINRQSTVEEPKAATTTQGLMQKTKTLLTCTY